MVEPEDPEAPDIRRRNQGDYVPLGDGELRNVVFDLSTLAKSSEESRLSLAGSQGKVGLAHVPNAPLCNDWLRPEGGAALGGTRSIDLVRPNDFRTLSKEIGLGVKRMRRICSELAEAVPEALVWAAERDADVLEALPYSAAVQHARGHARPADDRLRGACPAAQEGARHDPARPLPTHGLLHAPHRGGRTGQGACGGRQAVVDPGRPQHDHDGARRGEATMEQLAVWAEHLEGFVRVGTLWSERDAEEWYRKFDRFAFGSTNDNRALPRGPHGFLFRRWPRGESNSTSFQGRSSH